MDDQTRAPRFAVLVRGPRGRRLYWADSASTSDREFIAERVTELNAEYPNLTFSVGTGPELDGTPVAPIRYRPWVSA